MSKYSPLEQKYTPRKAVTKIDIETLALSGLNSIELGELTTITDEAREKAQQLGINVIIKSSYQRNTTTIDNLKKEVKKPRSSEAIKNEVGSKNIQKVIESVVAVLRERSLPVNENLVNKIVKKVLSQI